MAFTRHSHTKVDQSLAASSRDLMFERGWAALGVWALALGGWLVLLWGATNMNSPAARLTMPMGHWSAANWLAVFVMWAVMMAAMMLPSAAPMVMCFSALNRRRGDSARTFFFVAAYLALWGVFSGAATAAQWALQSAGWVSPMIVSRSPVFSAALLIIAGVFQFSPLKNACLRACRSPLGFLMSDWRDGLFGAWRMGMRHGLYCIGCCWGLMALLFVGGAMNLLWIAALAGLVAIEKLAPKGDMVAQLLGGVMIGAGIIIWTRSLLP
jgi:predicted metal-binding membrane protein